MDNVMDNVMDNMMDNVMEYWGSSGGNVASPSSSLFPIHWSAKMQELFRHFLCPD